MLEKQMEFLKVLERLRIEYEELKALRDAANELRNLREKLLVDKRFD
jgi:hypothetical protein